MRHALPPASTHSPFCRGLPALPALPALLLVVVLAALAAPAEVHAQRDGRRGPAMEETGPRFHLSARGAASLRNFNGFRVGEDLVTYGISLGWARPGGIQPWVEGARFIRPGLDCLPSLPCEDEGWMARAGAILALSQDELEPGVHGSFRVGVGATFADETDWTYLVGIELLWRTLPRVAPFVEFRWDHVAGINMTMAGVGLRVEL